jgi:hypothetical protein
MKAKGRMYENVFYHDKAHGYHFCDSKSMANK